MAISSILFSVGSTLVKGAFNAIKGVASGVSKSLVSKFVYGGIVAAAGFLMTKKTSKSGMNASPTYQSSKYTQTNPDLPLPIIYGTVKTAGNLLWQNSQVKYSQKVIAFSEGEITEFSDIRINDIPAEQVAGTKIERFYGTESQAVADVVPGNSQLEKIEKVGSLKNVAYLALTVFNNEKIASNYNLTAIIKGKKVRVYSSSTTYSVQYSENPAWILLDFLTSYNGLGLALNDNSEVDDDLIASIFDMNSFLESAAYCDDLAFGKPRFTFNMIFDAQMSVRALLDEIYRCCRGGLFFKNGLLQFKIDKAEPVSKVFNASDISNEVFKAVPSEEHFDILKCVYISPNHEWQKVEAFAEIPEYRTGMPTENTIEIFSCTNFNQASRLAWYYSNSKVLQPYFGSFDTDYRAYDLEVGDVIKFDSILMGINEYKVKVTQISDDGAGTYTVNWQTYDERLYADTLGSLEPRMIVSKLNDIYVYPPDVANFNVVQSGADFNFIWNKIENVTYEIRQGTDWQSAKIIASKIVDNFYSCEVAHSGLHTFLIKAFNKYNYSENATADIISVDYIPERNIILTQNILTQNGKFEKTYLYQDILKLSIENKTWQKLYGMWNDIELKEYSSQGLWGAALYSEGSFESEIFDLGKSFTSTLSISYENKGNVEILFKFADSLESLQTKVFKPFIKGEYTFRYYQIKINLFRNEDPNSLCYVKDVLLTIDVPDKTATYSIVVTDAQNGYDLNYSEIGFYSTPGIVATVTDSIYSYASTADKTPSSAKIYAISNEGAKTTGKIDVQLFGY